MHSAGTTLGNPNFTLPFRNSLVLTHYTEGPWDIVMRVIGQAHSLLHANGVVRIQSDIRVGSRTDKKQTAEDKVRAVEKLLAEDEKGEKDGEAK